MGFRAKVRQDYDLNHPLAKCRVLREYSDLDDLKDWQKKILGSDARIVVEGSKYEALILREAEDKAVGGAKGVAALERQAKALLLTQERELTKEQQLKAKKERDADKAKEAAARRKRISDKAKEIADKKAASPRSLPDDRATDKKTRRGRRPKD